MPNKEIIYIEEDTVVPHHARFYRKMLATFFILLIFSLIGLAAYNQVMELQAPADKAEMTILR